MTHTKAMVLWLSMVDLLAMCHMAVGQHQYCHFGAAILHNFSWDWDVHWGYGVLTHGHINKQGVLMFAKFLGRRFHA